MHRSHWFLVILVLGMAFVTGRWTARAQAPVPRGSLMPTILSGADIGFRVDRQNGDIPVGKLVVRMDGQWVEPEFAMGVRRLTPR
jgi:hypothetical protein